MTVTLIIQAARGEDYMADMCSHFLYQRAAENIPIYTNTHPPYLFGDFPIDAPLYGRGYTVYRKIPVEQRTRITIVDSSFIQNGIRARLFGRIIWTSIWRCSDYLNMALDCGYDRGALVVVDGEDGTDLFQLDESCVRAPLTQVVRYYKRELTAEKAQIGAQPISFKFPSIHPVLSSPFKPKSRILAGCDPRFPASYIYNSEQGYYENYQESLFAFTTQKSGWDCLRHYEILANNCIPVFPDILNMPTNTMVEWSRELQQRANLLWIHISGIRNRDISEELEYWSELMDDFRTLFERQMLTDALSFLIT